MRGEARDAQMWRFVALAGRNRTSEGTCTTIAISGIFSLSPRSRPIFIVIVDEGQVPHAPCSWR
jgi:hypothetical protein